MTILKFSMPWALCALLAAGSAMAGVPGSLDPAYGTQQGLTPFFVQGGTYAHGMQAMADGGWVTSGTIERQIGKAYELRPTLVRYRANGALDESFGDRGHVVAPFKLDSQLPGTFLAGDGQRLYMIVSDYRQLFVVAYFLDGRIDATYGSNGVSHVDIGENAGIYLGAVLHKGKLVIAGSGSPTPDGPSEFMLLRLTSNGVLDPTFAGGGKSYSHVGTNDQWNYFTGLALTGDDKLVAAGLHAEGGTQHAIVARYGANGALDNSFGNSGFRIVEWLDRETVRVMVDLQADGKAVVAGTTCADIGPPLSGWPCFVGVGKLTSNGAFDTSFGIGGKVVQHGPGVDTNANVHAMAVDPQGRVLTGGSVGKGSEGANSTAYLLRLRADGALDASFGANGMVYAPYGDAPKDHVFGIGILRTTPDRPSLFTIGYRQNGTADGLATFESVIARHFYSDDGPARAK